VKVEIQEKQAGADVAEIVVAFPAKRVRIAACGAHVFLCISKRKYCRLSPGEDIGSVLLAIPANLPLLIRDTLGQVFMYFRLSPGALGPPLREAEARWKEDIELMVAAGMNIVRMGEFTWGLCEPREGEFDFSWLKRIMDLMANEGIKVVLATPTAAPPIWLTKKHPEILPCDERGLPLCDGTRHACCLNSDLYWDYAKKIVRAMAEALGSIPNWSPGRLTTTSAPTPCSRLSMRRRSGIGSSG
jgi:hypothetical protein